ncbi:MAG: ATP-binding protein [Anaerolineae bacterium]
MARLSLRLFGVFQAAVDERPVTGFPYHKVQALLIYLAAEAGRAHERETLAGLFWPEESERNARKNLSHTLMLLRHAISDQDAYPPFLNITPQQLKFNQSSQHWIDVAAFTDLLSACQTHNHSNVSGCHACLERLEQAIALYERPFLEGFSLGDCPEFEEWCVLQRERYHRLALETLECLANVYEGKREYEQALTHTRHQLALDPWREEAHRQLMRLLASSGQRSTALAQYVTCRRVLAEELDVAPSLETTALYERIRAEQVGSAPEPPSFHVPMPLLPLLGRERELAEIKDFLQRSDTRLMTLVGPGGSGKTHLALAAAHRLGSVYTDQPIVVNLSAVQTTTGVVQAITQACGLVLHPEYPVQRQLLDYLQDKELLLVLDNLEQLVAKPPAEDGSLATLLLDILQNAPRVRILGTSRMRLNLASEYLLQVDGLPIPEAGEEESALTSFPSVQLFLATARRAVLSFAPTSEDMRSIAALCRLLNGMPLAILLAASWIEVLRPAQILAQVAHRYDFLETAWQDLPPRQRSVRAVLDHSWDLMSSREQQLFPALSVFRGGFNTTAAEQVAGISLSNLMRLTGKSLVMHLAGERYELHELLRQYAEDKLAGNSVDVHDQHSDYFLALVENRGAELTGPHQQAALTELELESENLRAAWEWAVTRNNISRLLLSVKGMCHLLEVRCRWEEGAALCAAAAEQFKPRISDHNEQRRLYTRLVTWQAVFEYMAGRVEHALQLAQQNLELLDQVAGNTDAERASVLSVIGDASDWLGQRSIAQEAYNQSLSHYQVIDDQAGCARLMQSHGVLFHEMGQNDKATNWYKASLQLRRAMGDQAGVANVLTSLAGLDACMGNLTQAKRRVQEAIDVYRDIADQAGLAKSADTQGCILVLSGEYGEALQYFEECLRYYVRLGQSVEIATTKHAMQWIYMNLGHYEKAREMLEAATDFVLQSGDALGMAYDRLTRAQLAQLAANGIIKPGTDENPLEAACRWAEQAAEIFHRLKADDEGLAWAELGFAAHLLGRHGVAKRYLCEALQAIQRSGKIQAAMSVMARLAVVLADDEPEQAVEIYALASHHPYIGNSRLWHDLLEPKIRMVAATFSPDLVEAAQKRGIEQDWLSVVNTWIMRLAHL